MSSDLTVLMPVYNGEPYLRTAVESILQQTYVNFRFLIVDDASTDGSRDIVRSYHDKRIELLCLDRNVGQTAALNIGLRHASTPWIARMDADDFSAPTRFETQLHALQSDSGLACVGTWGWAFISDPKVVEKIIVRPESDAEIKRKLLTGPPMIHGSLVLKREVLLEIGGYDEHYRYSADMEMYERLLRRCRAANIPMPLVGLRRHGGKGSSSIAALAENIEILRRRSSCDGYHPQERRIVRQALSRMYLHRARVRKETHLRFADYAYALWFHPRWIVEAIRRVVSQRPGG